MRTQLKNVGDTRCILIPASLLVACGIGDEVDIHQEGARIIIKSSRAIRQGWFETYEPRHDVDAWKNLPPDSDSGDWEW